MVREAAQSDAEQLRLLNEEFNGPCLRDAEQIAISLIENRQERVIVDE